MLYGCGIVRISNDKGFNDYFVYHEKKSLNWFISFLTKRGNRFMPSRNGDFWVVFNKQYKVILVYNRKTNEVFSNIKGIME